MFGTSIMHWAVVIILITVLFGRNKVSAAMKDLGGGLRNFKDGMREVAGAERQIATSPDRSAPPQTPPVP
jgi:sec-independent protein translocase protein TatA